MSTKILGIDYGKRKIGLSISSGQLAVPLEIIENNVDLPKALQEIINREVITGIVVGLPVSTKGRDTDSTQAARDFASSLQEKVSIPVELFNEQFSSAQAQKMGVGKNDDAVAASLMLQAYLDYHDNQ